MNTRAVKKPVAITNPSEDIQLELRRRIEKRAHELWVEGGCADGSTLSDWLQAEREISGQVSQPARQASPPANDGSSAATKGRIKAKPVANAHTRRALRFSAE